ncbi:MAG: hypothetical protein V4614_01695 [Pseudomonadota bacterium]
MFMRCAYLIGQPKPGKDAELQKALRAALPMYKGFDGLQSARLLLGQDHEEGAPAIYATLEFWFKDEAALNAALDKPYRQEFRTWFAANVTPLFDGVIKHINQDLIELAA